MILFISAWHLVAVLGLIGGLFGVPAFLAAARLWALWVGIGTEIEQAHDQHEEQQRLKRSAAGVKGWQTRRVKASTDDGSLPIVDERKGHETRRAAKALTRNGAIIVSGDAIDTADERYAHREQENAK